MKKKYEKPESKIVRFNVRDIVITSGGENVSSTLEINEAQDEIFEGQD